MRKTPPLCCVALKRNIDEQPQQPRRRNTTQRTRAAYREQLSPFSERARKTQTTALTIPQNGAIMSLAASSAHQNSDITSQQKEVNP